MFGGKTAGFVAIPAAWRPPALFISNQLYVVFRANDAEFKTFLASIWKDLQAFFASSGTELIIRSSATDETIQERGRFKSMRLAANASIDDFECVVRSIFDQYEAIGSRMMCLIAQRYYPASETGFLSNELRLVDKPYRWVLERYFPSSGRILPQISISAKQATTISTEEPIVCLSQQELRSRLRSVALYFWKLSPSQRILLEWCWDGGKLWIVQRDNASPGTDGRNPDTLAAAPFKPPSIEQGAIFQRYEAGTSTPWGKLKNVTDFSTGGRIPPHRLFYCVARVIASTLESPDLCTALEREINALTASHAVLRTDVIKKAYNLNRTQTVDGAGAINWLRTQIALWVGRGVSLDEVVFIMHSYIPARAAAWSYYRQHAPTVRIDALWGLADGMQYYPTDTVLCSAGSGVKISETIRYKELVLLEQDDGRWVTDRINPRYARHRVLSAAEHKEIALRTREIANNLKSDVQIMWFVGVPPEFNLEHDLPWYKVTPEQGVEERRSQLLESVIVRSADDLNKIKDIVPGSRKIVLEPSGEDLRSDAFISAVAEVCVRLNLPVEIRGSILSHAFHQLSKAGVQAFSAEPGKRPVEMRQRKAFDKLVRDQIPASILEKGEFVTVDELAPEELAAALIGKLFEEAEEFLAAKTPEEMLEELADLFEIVRALADASRLSVGEVIGRADAKRKRRGGFEQGVILRSTSLVGENPPVEPNLFGDESIRRRISLSSLVDQAPRRSETPVSALLAQGPRMVRLNLASGMRLTLRVELAAGLLTIVVAEVLDADPNEQPKLI
jgi:predicted house-cleaning noncanonical NTP pyrophosphatase (MazG superfamily)